MKEKEATSPEYITPILLVAHAPFPSLYTQHAPNPGPRNHDLRALDRCPGWRSCWPLARKPRRRRGARPLNVVHVKGDDAGTELVREKQAPLVEAISSTHITKARRTNSLQRQLLLTAASLEVQASSSFPCSWVEAWASWAAGVKDDADEVALSFDHDRSCHLRLRRKSNLGWTGDAFWLASTSFEGGSRCWKGM